MNKQEIMGYLEFLDNQPDEYLKNLLDRAVADADEDAINLVSREMRARGLLEEGNSQ